MVNTLRQLFTEPVTVVNEYTNNSPVFKVRIGQFYSIQDADRFRQNLKTEYNMDGIVQ